MTIDEAIKILQNDALELGIEALKRGRKLLPGETDSLKAQGIKEVVEEARKDKQKELREALAKQVYYICQSAKSDKPFWESIFTETSWRELNEFQKRKHRKLVDRALLPILASRCWLKDDRDLPECPHSNETGEEATKRYGWLHCANVIGWEGWRPVIEIKVE